VFFDHKPPSVTASAVTSGNRAVRAVAFALANDDDTQTFGNGADFGRFRLSVQIIRFGWVRWLKIG
jgi:hypothetical protein